MNILLLSHSRNDPDAGASRVYHTLKNGFIANGHTVIIYHYDDFKPVKFGPIRKIIDRLFLPQFIKFRLSSINLEDFDVIIAPSGVGYELYRRALSSDKRPLLVNHQHGLSFFDHRANLFEQSAGRLQLSLLYRLVSAPLTIFWDMQGARYSDVTVVQNDRDYDFLMRSGVGINRLAKIEPAIINDILCSHVLIKPENRPVKSLLWFGSWTARKGNQALISAFEKILDEEPEATLKIGGAPESEVEIRNSFSTRANKSLIVLPRISVEEQISLFNQCSIFLFPSLSEGFGLALLEAMSQKLAAVTTDTGVGGDWLEHGENTLIVPKGSSIHLAKATIRLMRDDKLRVKIAEAGSVVAQTFTEARMIKLYEEIFRTAKISSEIEHV